MTCRAPRGARGLKCRHLCEESVYPASRPARGAWIEIRVLALWLCGCWCRAPRGARGLKYITFAGHYDEKGRRAPRGARGLKFKSGVSRKKSPSRAPRGARGLKSDPEVL